MYSLNSFRMSVTKIPQWKAKLRACIASGDGAQGPKKTYGSTEPSRRQKLGPNNLAHVSLNGQSWAIPKSDRYKLIHVSLQSFSRGFIEINPTRALRDFQPEILRKAYVAFVDSQYANATARKKRIAMHRVKSGRRTLSRPDMLTYHRYMILLQTCF